MELLRPPSGDINPVDDIKFYTFCGEIALILIVVRRQREQLWFKWFTPEWEAVRVGRHEGQIDDGIQPPHIRGEMSRLAAEISASFPLPFVRVDVLNTDRGPVVGELTPLPGGSDGFHDEWDEQLGRLYEASSAKLLTQGMDWRRLHGRRGWRIVRPRFEAIAKRHLGSTPHSRLTLLKRRNGNSEGS